MKYGRGMQGPIPPTMFLLRMPMLFCRKVKPNQQHLVSAAENNRNRQQTITLEIDFGRKLIASA